MQRRRVLTACGTLVTGMLAGCSGGGEDGEGGDDLLTGTPTGTAEPTATATTTATATETAEPTATGTAEPTATSTAGPDGPTHGLDESFVVGTGNDRIGYRIIDFYRADRIGGSANYDTADGTFLIVILELSNPQNDATSFPQNRFLVTNEQQVRYVDDEATPKIASDDRIDTQPLATATVLSGSSKTGAVVFDVSPEQSYWIEIRPTGDDGETHYVEVGPVSDLPTLQSSMVG